MTVLYNCTMLIDSLDSEKPGRLPGTDIVNPCQAPTGLQGRVTAVQWAGSFTG